MIYLAVALLLVVAIFCAGYAFEILFGVEDGYGDFE